MNLLNLVKESIGRKFLSMPEFGCRQNKLDSLSNADVSLRQIHDSDKARELSPPGAHPTRSRCKRHSFSKLFLPMDLLRSRKL
jgi:hypothetical protein